MSTERRRHDRVDAKQAKVACTSADYAAPGSPTFNLAVRLLDTSASGACIVTKGRLRQGVRVVVGIVFPSQNAKVMSNAVVRWSTTVESKGRTAHVAGLEFDQPVGSLAPRAKAAPPAPAQASEPNRRTQRFTPDKVDIVCLPRGLLTRLGVKTNAARGLKNLSLGGAQIVSNQKLSAGDPVDLLLKFDYPKTSVRAVGVVRWCRRDTLSLEARWNVGVVFESLDASSHGRLKTVEAVFADRKK